MTCNGWYAIKTINIKSYIFNIYVSKSLALNAQQWLICHKPIQTKSYIFDIYA